MSSLSWRNFRMNSGMCQFKSILLNAILSISFILPSTFAQATMAIDLTETQRRLMGLQWSFEILDRKTTFALLSPPLKGDSREIGSIKLGLDVLQFPVTLRAHLRMALHQQTRLTLDSDVMAPFAFSHSELSIGVGFFSQRGQLQLIPKLSMTIPFSALR